MNKPLRHYVLKDVGCALLFLAVAAIATAILYVFFLALKHGDALAVAAMIIGGTVFLGVAAGYDDWRRGTR